MHAELEQLYRGESLDQPTMQALIARVVAGEAEPLQLAALLVALKIKGETPFEIAGAASAIRAAATPFAKPAYPVADIVGTGGDGHHTLNISSTAMLVAAAAGVKVAKHGNRSVSSKSGSADLLEALGIKLDMSPQLARQALDELGCCFLFAPVYHSGFRHAGPVRAALKTRTLFNVLGPLVNPAHPEYMLLGVYSPALVAPIAEALALLGVKRALVVHGSGLDEIAIHAETQAVLVDNGELSAFTITPEALGLARYPLSALVGGDAAHNAELTRAILAGHGQDAHVSAVAANAGALIFVAGLAESLSRGVSLALEVIASGKAAVLAQRLAEVSHG